jgi:tetratricopeptide (TPR) repeat protein
MKKEFEKAFADLDKAVEITAKQSPKMQARAYEARGLVYPEKQDTQKGLDDLDEAIRRDPKLASAYRNRADVFVGKKDYDKAIADLTEAIGLEPLSRSYSYRANLRLLKREYANAISDCKETIRLDPMDDITMVILARLLATVPNAEMRDGKYALELGLRANQLKNESFLCMEAVASAHAELGDFAEAIRWQEKAVARAGAIDVFGASFRLSMYKQKRPFRLD